MQNLGISKGGLSTRGKAYEANEGAVSTRGRRNFESDKAKESARLRKQLKDTQDAIETLKNNRHTGKMAEALILEAAEYEGQLLEQGERRLNVSGVLKLLGVSRSGYLSFRKRLPSSREKRKRY